MAEKNTLDGPFRRWDAYYGMLRLLEDLVYPKLSLECQMETVLLLELLQEACHRMEIVWLREFSWEACQME